MKNTNIVFVAGRRFFSLSVAVVLILSFLAILPGNTYLTPVVSAAKLTGNTLKQQATKECEAEAKKRNIANNELNYWVERCVINYTNVYEGANPSSQSCQQIVADPSVIGGVRFSGTDEACVAGQMLGEKAVLRDGGNEEATVRKVCKTKDTNQRAATDGEIAACKKGYQGAKNKKSREEACKDYNNDSARHLKPACIAGYNAQKNNATTASIDTAAIDRREEESQDSEANVCDGMGPLAWIVCPLVSATLETINTLDNLINDLLTVNTKAIFDTQDTTSSGARYKQAWSDFRSIALGLIAIAALVTIIATAFGFEIFDAYTIRKVLPRFLVAIIFITLSWNVMNFLIQLSNDAGNGIRALIYLPFKDMVINFNAASGIFSWGVIVGAFAATGFSLIGLLSFAVTGLIAVLIAFLVLIVRELIIILLVIIAPIGIACLILPNTRKAWQLWQNTFTAMLVVFPIISAMIATGRVFAATITANDSAGAAGDIVNNIIAFIAYVLPYLLLPFAFRAAGGLMATLAGISNDRSKGVFDRLRGFRENKRQKRYQDAIQSKNRLGRTPIGSITRRMHLADQGGLSLGSKGRARYRAASQSLLNKTTAEMLKADDGRAANDDDGTALAIQKGMTRSRYLKEYADKMRQAGFSDAEAKRRALDSLGAMEASFGAMIGTPASRAAAFRARAMSATAYGVDPMNPDATYQQMFRDAADMVNSGLMTEADTIAAFKQNKSRADISGFSFMDGIRQVQETRKSGTVTSEQAKKLRKSALAGSRPGEILAGRHETVTALAPEMTAQLNAAVESGDQTAVMQELAALAGKYDAMASISPKNAKIMADNVFGQTLKSAGDKLEYRIKDAAGNPTDQTMTIRQMIEAFRNNSQFLDLRREYAAREERAAREITQHINEQIDPNQT